MTTCNPLKEIITLQKQGKPVGIYSACSADKYVIKAVLERAKEESMVALIEATANQCDQYGGYTGMTPKDFVAYVQKLASEIAMPVENIFLGGDHLGPLTWVHMNEEEAMNNAKELIRQYVLAGFTKIHIDTSMRVASDEPTIPLSLIAKRGAILAKVANDSYQLLRKQNPNAMAPVYIVGSEVPIPGGAQGEDSDTLQVTTVSDFKSTVATFKEAFEQAGIATLWGDVIAVVVQPGVEEKDAGCVEYDREKARGLMLALKEYPNLVFEGHSTDYQTKYKLKELVEDGVAILKVGPGLTFAMREGMFALANIEEEIFKDTPVMTSRFIEVLEKQMLKQPDKWEKYYLGDANEIRLKRKYSFSDRCRYYMSSKEVEKAKQLLLQNLCSIKEIPLHVLSQYMPVQYTKVREGVLDNHAEAILKDRIINTIDVYLYATNQQLL